VKEKSSGIYRTFLSQISRAASVEFAQLFPDLLRQPYGAPHQTLAGNQRHYYSLLEAPQRRVSALRSVPPPAERHDEQHQKALRILNAGLSLCVTGETGCGKEHFSRRLFQESRWRNGNFVAINCAALPEPLIESELFGYAPGAFTGANPKGYIGKIREADGGVLFLDEIGDMPAGLQTRLLRVLQEKMVTPLGSRSAYPVDFALVCATHHDLHRQGQAGVCCTASRNTACAFRRSESGRSWKPSFCSCGESWAASGATFACCRRRWRCWRATRGPATCGSC